VNIIGFNYLPLFTTIDDSPNNGDSFHKSPCHNSVFHDFSTPGPKYIFDISVGLLIIRCI
jgi:hypothetical protein